MLYRWTPQRRELDSLRSLSVSNQSAKEVKVFGLGKYLTSRARGLFSRFYTENRQLAFRRAMIGALLNFLPTGAYYLVYASLIARTIIGHLTIGGLTFVAGSFAKSRSIVENLFSTFSNIAEQALYLRDLFDFFETNPTIVSVPGALPGPRPIRAVFEFRHVSFAYRGSRHLVLRTLSFRIHRP